MNTTGHIGFVAVTVKGLKLVPQWGLGLHGGSL